MYEVLSMMLFLPSIHLYVCTYVYTYVCSIYVRMHIRTCLVFSPCQFMPPTFLVPIPSSSRFPSPSPILCCLSPLPAPPLPCFREWLVMFRTSMATLSVAVVTSRLCSMCVRSWTRTGPYSRGMRWSTRLCCQRTRCVWGGVVSVVSRTKWLCELQFTTGDDQGY